MDDFKIIKRIFNNIEKGRNSILFKATGVKYFINVMIVMIKISEYILNPGYQYLNIW